MKTTLIKTNNSLILTSDENIVGGDKLYRIAELCMITAQEGWNNTLDLGYRKVLSQSPKLSKEVADEIGWIDVEEEIYGCFGEEEWRMVNRNAKLALIETFQKAQELNQKKYTEEDFFNFCQIICEKLPNLKKLQTSQADDYGNNLDIVLKIKDEFIKSLLRNQWQVEAEEIDGQWFVTKVLK